MRIKNETLWNTEDLRKVFGIILTETSKHEGHFPSKRLKITVVYTRGGGFSGWAFLRSGRMHLRLPHPHRHGDLTHEAAQPLDIYKLAHLFEHELLHCRGFKHKGMGCLNDWENATASFYPYLAEMSVRLDQPKAVPPRPKQDVQIVRYERAMGFLAKWQAKRKSAQNHERRYQQQVKRYERIFASDGRLAALKAKKG